MDLNANPMAALAIPQPSEAAPPPAQSDGRAVADVAASKSDPRPDLPMPMPPSPSQTGLVSQSALSKTDEAPKLGPSAVSPAERTLKPYGINMLPETNDNPEQKSSK